MPYELKIFKKNKEINKNLIKWQSAGGRLIFNTDVLDKVRNIISGLFFIIKKSTFLIF